MTGFDLSSMTDVELVATYRAAALAHLAHSATGAYKKANSQAEIIAACDREPRGCGTQRGIPRSLQRPDDAARVASRSPGVSVTVTVQHRRVCLASGQGSRRRLRPARTHVLPPLDLSGGGL